MARTRTLTNLIADCRMRAGMENSTFVTDAEITEYLNQELAELHGRLALNQAHPFLRSSSTISVLAGTALYSLPDTFWRLDELVGVINGITVEIRPFMRSERAPLINNGAWGDYLPVFYRLQGSQIELRPATQTFTATLYYTPCATRLSAGSDTFDGYNGFEMAAIYGTVATMLAKEESDYSFYAMQKDRIYLHIDSLAQERDGAYPDRVQDVVGWGEDPGAGRGYP